MKRKRIYHYFFPEGQEVSNKKLRWTIMIILQELRMGKFKAVFKYFVKKSYRKDINLLRDILSKGGLKGTKTNLPLKDIYFSHEINYPKWVEKLERDFIVSEVPYKRIKVFKHEGKYIVIDGNHRLKAMKRTMSNYSIVPVLELTYKD